MSNWFKDAASAITTVGDLLKSAFGLIDQAVEDKDEANRHKAETAQKLFALLERGGWFEKNWRGISMLFVSGTVCYEHIAGFAPDWIMLSLLVVGLIGYRLDGVLEFMREVSRKKEDKK